MQKIIILILFSFTAYSQLSGTKDETGVSLDWSITGFDKIEVYRSNDAQKWEKVGESYPTPIFNNTNFYDAETSWLYYRLRFIGKESFYSNIIYFGFNKNYKVKVIKQLDSDFKLTIVRKELFN